MGFLTGKTINDIKIASDKKAILFICEDGNHVAHADGDCCSETWVESIELPALGFPCLVHDDCELELNTPPLENEHFEHCQFYGYKISTDKGEVIIDYRNESNGYYGGDLCFPDGSFYGGVYGQNESNLDWIDVEE